MCFSRKGTVDELKGKRVGLVTNHTGVDSAMRSTIDLFLVPRPRSSSSPSLRPSMG